MNEWIKTIEKIGVIVPTMDQLKALFRLYDADQDGFISCREFANILYSKVQPEQPSLNLRQKAIEKSEPSSEERHEKNQIE